MSTQIEHIIRDWLVAHPDFIEEGLQVLDKEHYLFDEIGSSGFIDILCQDVYQNFVIVEIKRSDAAARQTFTEVLKYAELIQHTYNAKDSELRIIIISTHWNEIIRAFSQICFKSQFAVQGLQIYINEETKIPQAKEEVVPISSRAFSRKFMSSQVVYLFLSDEKRQKAHLVLEQKLKEAGIRDFVTVDLDAPAEKPRMYPFAINAAFQKHSKEELLQSVALLNGEHHLDKEEDEFDVEEEYLDYLEDVFISSLEMQAYIDSLEAGSAETFASVTGIQNWRITSINRFGIFGTDPRYSTELLIRELKGHDGNSPNQFFGFSESKQKERIKEIRTASEHSLAHTPSWAEFIDTILSRLEKSKEKFKVIVDIYNPDSIVTALYFALTKDNPDYLPLFLIIIDYPDKNETEFYRGEVLSNARKPKFKLFTSHSSEELQQELFRVWLDPDNEKDAKGMGLRYCIQKTVIVDGNEISNGFVEMNQGEINRGKGQYISIPDYIVSNHDALSVMIRNCSNWMKVV